MTVTRTSTFLLANLGSEVSRLQSAIAKGDEELAQGAISRARGIFDKISAIPMRESVNSEMKILREVIEDLPKQNHRFSVDAKSLQNYFLPFAQLILNTKHEK